MSILDGLPADIGELCKIVQGTTVHIFWAERYGIKHTAERQAEVQLRTVKRRLACILGTGSRAH